jgi:hypothetical protein
MTWAVALLGRGLTFFGMTIDRYHNTTQNHSMQDGYRVVCVAFGPDRRHNARGVAAAAGGGALSRWRQGPAARPRQLGAVLLALPTPA